MTPALFDLPLRLADAVRLAELIFQHAENKALNDEVRSRIGGRALVLDYQGMRPWPDSLERDPIHPSAYYMCVDGIAGQPLLLRIALASAPSSGLFPKAILIGRTKLLSREIVINVVPFGPADSERIRTFSERLNPAFLPKMFGARPVIRVRSAVPAQTFPAAFGGFRELLKSKGQNLACFALSPGQDQAAFYDAVVWSAIRSGWREGFAMEAYPETIGEAKSASMYTRFGVRAVETIAAIRTTRGKPFDAEWISVSGDLAGELEALREEGYAVQSIAFGGAAAVDADTEAIAQRYRAVINTCEVVLEAGLSAQEIVARIVGA